MAKQLENDIQAKSDDLDTEEVVQENSDKNPEIPKEENPEIQKEENPEIPKEENPEILKQEQINLSAKNFKLNLIDDFYLYDSTKDASGLSKIMSKYINKSYYYVKTDNLDSNQKANIAKEEFFYQNMKFQREQRELHQNRQNNNRPRHNYEPEDYFEET